MSNLSALCGSDRYFQNPGSSGMQSSTPTTQSQPPETMEKRGDTAPASHPARALPSSGPVA
jgi:hypothetical protein